MPDIDRKPLEEVLIHLDGTEGGILDAQPGIPALDRPQSSMVYMGRTRRIG